MGSGDDFAVVLVLCLPGCEDIVRVSKAEQVEGSQHEVVVGAVLPAAVLPHLQPRVVVAVAADHQQVAYQRLEGGTFEALGGELSVAEVGEEDGMVDEDREGIAEGDQEDGEEDGQRRGGREERRQVHGCSDDVDRGGGVWRWRCKEIAVRDVCVPMCRVSEVQR